MIRNEGPPYISTPTDGHYASREALRDDYLSDIWRLRYFWTALVRNDLRNRYRRSIIGIGWSLLHPIAMTVVLCAVLCPLFQQTGADYAPFLLSGLTLWGFIMAVVTQGCHCFFQGES